MYLSCNMFNALVAKATSTLVADFLVVLGVLVQRNHLLPCSGLGLGSSAVHMSGQHHTPGAISRQQETLLAIWRAILVRHTLSRRPCPAPERAALRCLSRRAPWARGAVSSQTRKDKTEDEAYP